VIGPPDSAVSGPQKPPKGPCFRALAAKTCARSTMRAYETSPILLTTLPHSYSPMLPTSAHGPPAVGRTDGRPWG